MTLSGDSVVVKAAGNYAPFVRWLNFVAGFAYIITGVGFWMQQRWAAWLAIAIAVATSITFAAFGRHVYSGGAYEQRTVIATSLRTSVWVAIAAIT